MDSHEQAGVEQGQQGPSCEPPNTPSFYLTCPSQSLADPRSPFPTPDQGSTPVWGTFLYKLHFPTPAEHHRLQDLDQTSLVRCEMLTAYPVPWCQFSLPLTHLYTCTRTYSFLNPPSFLFFFSLFFSKVHPSGSSFVLLEAIMAVSEEGAGARLCC